MFSKCQVATKLSSIVHKSDMDFSLNCGKMITIHFLGVESIEEFTQIL